MAVCGDGGNDEREELEVSTSPWVCSNVGHEGGDRTRSAVRSMDTQRLWEVGSTRIRGTTTADADLRSVEDIPFEFVGKVAGACTVAKASHVEGSTASGHG